MSAPGIAGRAAALLLGALVMLSCSGNLGQFPHFGASPETTEEDLNAAVLSASGRFVVAVTAAADAVGQQTRDRDVRRRALLWKVRMTPLVARAALTSRPMEALIQLLALSVAQRQYLVEGSGSALFGDQQPVAQESAIELEKDLRDMPRSFLSAEQARGVEREVDREARKFPISGEFLVADAHQMFAAVEASSALQSVLDLPFAPFRVFSGVESGAAAMHELNASGRQFNAVLSGFPQQSRWQLELLLYDLEDRETVISARRSFEQIAESSARFSSAVEALPHSVRTEVEALLARSDAAQVQLRTTVQGLQAGIADADQLVTRMQRVAGSLERMAAHIQGAATSLGDTARSLGSGAGGVGAAGPVESRGRGFDIRDYETTAAHVESAAAEVRRLLSDVGEGAPGAHRLIDWIFWRAAFLLVLWFALLLLYRLALGSFSTRGSGARRHS